MCAMTGCNSTPYQEAFFTPGISPLYANSRKQILQIPYFLKYACGRPQILQRLYSLVENFCGRCCLIFIAVLAMNFPPIYQTIESQLLFCPRHVELCKQFTCFFVCLSSCYEDNIHTSDFINLIVFDFREN